MNKKRSFILDIMCIILLVYIGLTTKLGILGKVINFIAIIVLIYSAYTHYVYFKNDKPDKK